jgi:sulfate adenylyltransferase subunit 1 (EFTu-like GTPase family)
MVTTVHQEPHVALGFDATLVWHDDAPVATDATWLVRHAGRTVRAHFAAIARAEGRPAFGRAAREATMRARIRLHAPLWVGDVACCRDALAFLVIDETTQRTVAHGTIDTDAHARPPVRDG